MYMCVCIYLYIPIYILHFFFPYIKVPQHFLLDKSINSPIPHYTKVCPIIQCHTRLCFTKRIK